MVDIYGLKNCDTCRKALKWLQAEGLSHSFIDLRGDAGMDRATVEQALADVGPDKLINRRGTTWRKLPETARAATGSELTELLLQQPALMKRPIFIDAAGAFVGFDAASQARLKG